MDTRLYKSKEKKLNKHLFYLLILLLLTYVTFHLVLKDIRFGQLYHIIKGLNIFICFLGLLAVFLFIFCEAMVFKTILSLLDEKLPFLQVLKYSIIGFYFSSITPSASGGQPMQLYYMKRDSISLSKGSLTVLITLIMYQITMLAYGTVSIMLNLIFIMDDVPSIYPLIIFGCFANITLMGFIFMSLFSSSLTFTLSDYLIKLLHKLKIIKDREKAQAYAKVQITQYKEGARLISNNPMSILFILLVTFIQHTSMYSVTYLVYKALGLNGISFWNILGLQSVSHIASSFIPLPGSVGVSETASLLIFKNIFPVNILSSAILIIRLISFYIMILVTGIFTGITHFLYGLEK